MHERQPIGVKPEQNVLNKHGQALEHWVETRVLTNEPNLSALDVEGIKEGFTTLSPREKVDLLYEKLTAFYITDKIIKEEQKGEIPPDPVDPYLVAEIKTLWNDEGARRLALEKYGEARKDAIIFRLSPLGNRWGEINELIDETRQTFESETRRLFLQQVTRPDQVSATVGRTKRLAQGLIKFENERDDIVGLKDREHVKENTDIAAEIMFQQLSKYHNQLDQGFVWLPSRDVIHTRIIESLQNGRWPVLKGEAGTGKSEQADAAAVALTGEQPTHIACSERTNERDLIADKEIDPQTGGSYDEYGPVMRAATGFDDSRHTEPQLHTGRIVRLDESGRLGTQGYAIIKELRQKRTATPEDIKKWQEGQSIDAGKLLYGKPVLPGFSSIWTTNPVGSRYPDRSEPDAALRREVADIVVDYPPMTKENPELYEFMLAALMDQNHHISVAKEEIAPSYGVEPIPNGQVLEDGRKIVGEEYIKPSTDKEHGTLYRLAFAIRSLQDAFTYGNSSSIPEDALRYTIDDSGKMQVVEIGGDPLTLNSSTITLREVTSWMKGFSERALKDDSEYQTETLTDWIKLKINTYINQVNPDDREKIRALFESYHLFDDSPNLDNAKPLTPKEIGYLSPRVPRPLHATEPTEKKQQDATSPNENLPTIGEKRPEVLHDKKVMLEEGDTLLINPGTIEVNMQEQ